MRVEIFNENKSLETFSSSKNVGNHKIRLETGIELYMEALYAADRCNFVAV